MVYCASSIPILWLLLYSLQSLIFTVNSTPLHRRASDDDCDIPDETITLDGPTSDQSAGIGVEFETHALLFQPVTQCSPEDIFPLKGSVVGGRTGADWELTGDTTFPGFLSAEYIMNGKTIKLGQSTAGTTAAEIAADLVNAYHIFYSTVLQRILTT
jgi:hypothetical protein